MSLKPAQRPDGGVVTQRTANPVAQPKNQPSSARFAFRSRYTIPPEMITRAENLARQTLNGDELSRARARCKSTPRTTFERIVYFAGAEDGPVKIGMTCDVRRRIKELRTQTKSDVRLLALAGGGSLTEGLFHRQFSQLHLGNEWFERCPEIEAEIARLNSIPQEAQQ